MIHDDDGDDDDGDEGGTIVSCSVKTVKELQSCLNCRLVTWRKGKEHIKILLTYKQL